MSLSDSDVKCKGGDKWVGIYLFDNNDVAYNDEGEMRVKRKYGKFKREVQYIDLTSEPKWWEFWK